MIEPRAWEIEDGNGQAFVRLHRFIDINRVVAVKKTKLVTVADVLASLREPSEAMWGGLARDIVFWLDTTDKRTPRSLFEFLGNVGREVPEWLKAHMEMANLDHAISKGTRAIIIFLAMLDQFEKEQANSAKKAYEADNPLGGPARMFEAIAERIRSGENYYAVLADYGVTVGAK